MENTLTPLQETLFKAIGRLDIAAVKEALDTLKDDKELSFRHPSLGTPAEYVRAVVSREQEQLDAFNAFLEEHQPDVLSHDEVDRHELNQMDWQKALSIENLIHAHQRGKISAISPERFHPDSREDSTGQGFSR